MYTYIIRFLAILSLLLSSHLSASNCYGNELRLQFHDTATQGQVTVGISEAKKLAGMKIGLIYHDTSVTYTSSTRSEHTNNFLHVVNDKDLGKLTIVMASAIGISGENIPLIHLKFLKKSGEELDKAVSIETCQLMNESLKELPCKIVNLVLP